MKILVMDDDVFVREFVKETLELDSHHVIVCSKGEDAITLFKDSVENNQPFEILLLDMINDLGLGGPETLSAIKKISENIYSILISGTKFDEIEDEYKKLGFQKAISKPFSVDDLLQVIENIRLK